MLDRDNKHGKGHRKQDATQRLCEPLSDQVREHGDGNEATRPECRGRDQRRHPQHQEAGRFIRPWQGIVENVAEEDLRQDHGHHQRERNPRQLSANPQQR